MVTNIAKDIQHHLFLITLDGKLSLAPITEPRMVLDIGTGTGNWAMEFGKLIWYQMVRYEVLISLCYSNTEPLSHSHRNRVECNPT
jgi:hypothetical protein